jgi:hypothetical protein
VSRTPSATFQVLGRIRPAASATRPAPREPFGVAVAKVVAVLSGLVLVTTLAMLAASILGS